MKRLLNKHSMSLVVSVIIIVCYLSVSCVTLVKIHVIGSTIDVPSSTMLTKIMSDLKEFALIAVGFVIKDKMESHERLEEN